MNFQSIIIFCLVLSNLILPQDVNKLHKDYFPFNEGIELIFDSNSGETTKSIVKTDSLFKVISTSSKFVYTQSLIEKNDGIYIVKTEQNISTFFYSAEFEITYSEPILQLPKPLIVGYTWSWSGFQVKNGDTTSVSIKGEVLKEVEIEVPAGKFNTIKVKMFFEEVDGEKTTLYKWLAPNVGSVKTKVLIEGSGVTQIAMSILGYDEIDSELKEIRYLE